MELAESSGDATNRSPSPTFNLSLYERMRRARVPTPPTPVPDTSSLFVLPSRGVVSKAGSTRKPLDIDYYRSLRVPSPPPLRSSPPIPTCAACRAKNRLCVITVITGNKNRSCDYCRRTHSKCVFEGTEADQTPENAGTKRRRTGAEDSADPKGKKPRRQASEEIEIIDGPRVAEEKVSPLYVPIDAKLDAVKNDGRRNAVGVTDIGPPTRLETTQVPAENVNETAGRTVQDEGRGNMPEVADAHKVARLETTLREVAANMAALTEVVTRNMTAIAEERRERMEHDRKTSETMNLMLKIMYKMVNNGSLQSASP